MNQNRNRKGNCPNLRFPEFEGEWVEKKLGEVCKMQAGKFINASEISDKQSNNLFPCYGGNGLRGYAKSFNQDGILSLIGRQGALCGNVTLADGKFYATEHAIMVTSNKDFDTIFIFHLLTFLNLNQYATGQAQPGLSVQNLVNLQARLPNNKEEQNKIASLLSLIDKRIETQRKIIEKYESLIKGLSESLFFLKLGFENFERSWETKYGDEIFENVSDKNHDSSYPILAITQQHGAIPRDLIDYNVTVTDKSIENYKAVQIGDFIISLRSFQGGIEYSNYLGICSPAYIVLKPIIPINRIFYKYYLKTSRYIAVLNKNLEGIRDGKMISYKQFSEIALPYPAIAEQNKIASTLAAVDSKLELERQLLTKYSEQKQYLLNNLFT